MSCSNEELKRCDPCLTDTPNRLTWAQAMQQVMRGIQKRIEASQPIPRNPAGCSYEPGYASGGHMVEVSSVPAIIGDKKGPERVLLAGGIDPETAHNVAKVLDTLPVGADAYDIAEALVRMRIVGGSGLLKFTPEQFRQIQVYQRVRARYHG